MPTKTKKPIRTESPRTETSVDSATKPAETWAKKGSLPTAPYKDVVLPSLNEKIRVRFLSNVEATQLALLPDLARFAELMGRLQDDDKTQPLTTTEIGEINKERVTYMVKVAHLTVIDPDEGPMERKCEDCGLMHLPSLWSSKQTAYLHPNDLATIAQIAERGWELERVAPLSRDQMESTSSPPVDTGESIQPTSS